MRKLMVKRCEVRYGVDMALDAIVRGVDSAGVDHMKLAYIVRCGEPLGHSGDHKGSENDGPWHHYQWNEACRPGPYWARGIVA